MAPRTTEGPPTWQALGDLIKLVGRSNAPHLRLRLCGAIAMTLAGKALGVLAPLVLGAAVNHLAADQPTGVAVGLGFAGFAVGWAIVRLLSAIAPNASDVVFAPVRSAAQRTAATETFAHALNLSLDFHQTKRSGSLSRTMDRGARSVDFLLRILAFNLVPTGVELVLAAGVLAGKYDWRFGAVAVVVVAVYAASTFALSNWRLEHRREMNAADTEAAGVSVDALLNYETVKSFGAEARAARTYEAALGDYTRASLKANSSLALLNVMQAVIMNVGLGVMAVMAGFEAAAGRMGPGDVTAAVLILISLYAPLNILGFAYREIRQSFIDMEEMLKVTRQTPQVGDAHDAVPLPRRADANGASLTFEQVGFRHDSRANGLEDVSFVSPPGTTTALVGPSGSGKSTMIRLLMKEEEATKGEVYVAGKNLEKLTSWKVPYLRRNIGTVFQDYKLLIDKTVFENVGFALEVIGKPKHVIDQRVPEILEYVGLGDKLNSYPDELSGGEQQRVSIARACVNRPLVLLADEPTGNLDPNTSVDIMRLLDKVNRIGTTVVMATHDQAIVDAMRKRVVELDKGRVIRDQARGVYS